MNEGTWQSPLAEPRFQFVLVTVLVLFGAMIWLFQHAFADDRDVKGRVLELQQTADAILYLDEVLTQSARLGAFTNDPYWQARYHAHAPRLEQAMDRAIALASGAGADLERTRDTKQRLIALELESFAQARAGRHDAARDILLGPAYEEDRRAYSDGLTEIRGHLARQGEDMERRLRRNLMLAGSVLALLGLVVVSALLVVLQQLAKRLDLERMLGEISRKLVLSGHDEVDENVRWVLGRLVSRLQARHGYLLRQGGGGASAKSRDWLAPGTSPALVSLMGARGEPEEAGLIHFSRTKSLPEATCPEKALLTQLGIDSLLGFTLKRDRGVTFFLGFTFRKGRPRWNEANETLLRTIAEMIVRVVENKEMGDSLARLATTDSLTGLSNRRHFTEELAREMRRCQRKQEPSALLILDMDFFKKVNDAHGHAAGDAVLVHFAACARATLRQIDLIGRLGGEEFGVILPDTRGDNALVAAERLRKAIETSPTHNEGRVIPITVSIGVTLLRGQDASVDQPLSRADRALYAAKEAGRNNIKSA
jgi:diguanylate cyclase (GGDEF)-like protein